MDLKALSGIEVKDGARGLVTAVFATFDVIDADGDVTRPGAFEEGRVVPISAYGHASWGSGPGALPVGKGTIRSTATEAIVEATLFMGTTGGRETLEVLRELGPLGEWSYGYRVVKSSQGEWQGRKVRFLEELAVDEISPVLKGAGIGVRTLVAKSASANRAGLDLATRAELELRRAKLSSDRAGELLERLERSAVKAELAAELAELRDRASIHYREVAAAGVDQAKRNAADALLRFCARDLGLDPAPALRWFIAEGPEERAYVAAHGVRDWDGFARLTAHDGLARKTENDAWIHAALPFHRCLYVVAHEARHHWQFRTGAGADDPEGDARAYGHAVAGMLASEN